MRRLPRHTLARAGLLRHPRLGTGLLCDKIFFTQKLIKMPVTTGPACLVNQSCPIVPLPAAIANCVPQLSPGGINDLYIIPCTEAMTEVNILDTAWWTTLKSAGHLGNLGLGIGSIGKKSTKTEKISSCRPDQIISATWGLKYTIKAFDKSSADVTTGQVNAILSKYANFQLIARMCDGDDTVLPVGRFSVSDFDWIVPESSEDIQSVMLELSWIEMGKPKVYTVAGLSAIVPKA